MIVDRIMDVVAGAFRLSLAELRRSRSSSALEARMVVALMARAQTPAVPFPEIACRLERSRSAVASSVAQALERLERDEAFSRRYWSIRTALELCELGRPGLAKAGGARRRRGVA